MRTLPLLVALLLPAAPAWTAGKAADPAADGEPFELAEHKAKLKFATDGKGHYVAFVPFGSSDTPMFYGDGKTFWQLRVFGGGSGGDGKNPDDYFDHVFWEPRAKFPYQASFEFRHQKYQVQCHERKTEMRAVPDDEAKKLTDTSKFYKARWKRRAYALARDNTGKYYYVDQAREPEGNSDFHLYAGPKGGLKAQKMTNVVSDSEGDIFATKTGSLRLILNKSESLWQAGGKKEKLIFLPVEDNHILIYTDLGVYTGMPLGTPCDDL
jgi:hypothetical protein